MRSVNAHLFKDVMWEMTAKALLKTVRTKPPRRAAMDWEDLEKLVRHCMTSETLQVLRLALVVGFLAFLRASNLASNLADILPRGGSLLFHLRWTKTLQRTGQDVYIPLAPLKGSVLEPQGCLEGLSTGPTPRGHGERPAPSGHGTLCAITCYSARPASHAA